MSFLIVHVPNRRAFVWSAGAGAVAAQLHEKRSWGILRGLRQRRKLR
jgi:hypothetical protein